MRYDIYIYNIYIFVESTQICNDFFYVYKNPHAHLNHVHGKGWFQYVSLVTKESLQKLVKDVSREIAALVMRCCNGPLWFIYFKLA